MFKKDKTAVFYFVILLLFLLTALVPSIQIFQLLLTQMSERILFICVFSLALLSGFAVKNIRYFLRNHKYLKKFIFPIVYIVIFITFYPQVYTVENKITPLGLESAENVYSNLNVSDNSKVLASYASCWVCLITNTGCGCNTWDSSITSFTNYWSNKLSLLYDNGFEGHASEIYSLVDVGHLVIYANPSFYYKLAGDPLFSLVTFYYEDEGYQYSVFTLNKHFKVMVPECVIFLEDYSDFENITSFDYFIAEKVLYIHPTVGMPEPSGMDLVINKGELNSSLNFLKNIYENESMFFIGEVSTDFDRNNKRVYTNLSKSSFILVSMMYYPTWHAVGNDGLELPVYMCDSGLLCVFVPDSVDYFDLVWIEPYYTYFGIVSSFISLIAVLILIFKKDS